MSRWLLWPVFCLLLLGAFALNSSLQDGHPPRIVLAAIGLSTFVGLGGWLLVALRREWD